MSNSSVFLPGSLFWQPFVLEQWLVGGHVLLVGGHVPAYGLLLAGCRLRLKEGGQWAV